MKKSPINHNCRWSASEVQALQDLVYAGKSSSQIAKALGRTRSSVLTKKSSLGLEDRIQNGPTREPLTWRKNGGGAPRQSKPILKTKDITSSPDMQKLLSDAAALGKSLGVKVRVYLEN